MKKNLNIIKESKRYRIVECDWLYSVQLRYLFQWHYIRFGTFGPHSVGYSCFSYLEDAVEQFDLCITGTWFYAFPGMIGNQQHTKNVRTNLKQPPPTNSIQQHIQKDIIEQDITQNKKETTMSDTNNIKEDSAEVTVTTAGAAGTVTGSAIQDTMPTDLASMSGAFVDSLKRNSKQIRGDRAIAIAEDAQIVYKRVVEDLQRDLRQMKRDQESMLDMAPDNALSIKVASDFKGVDYVRDDMELGIKIDNTERKLRIALDRYVHLFGAL